MVIRKKYNKTRKQRNTLETSDEDIDNLFYYDIDTLLKRVQYGSGYTKTSKQKYIRTVAFFQTLLQFGWQENYVISTFGNMDDSLLPNMSYDLIIEKTFKHIIQQKGFKNSIKESLKCIGLNEDIAKKLDNILLPLADSCYTDTQLLDKAIEYIIGRHNPITSSITTHPIMPEYVDSWIDYRYKSRILPIYNMSFQSDNMNRNIVAFQKVLRHLQRNIGSIDVYYFFHTTSWNSSYNIIDFINHKKGRPCLDFGIDPAFYLSPQLNDAVEWFIKNKKYWNDEVAILIFCIPKQLPSNLFIKILKNDEWTNVTRKSRECKEQNELEKVRNFDFIYGDMVKNPQKVKAGIELPITHKPPKKQLVGRTINSDRFLQSCLTGCVYFQKTVKDI